MKDIIRNILASDHASITLKGADFEIKTDITIKDCDYSTEDGFVILGDNEERVQLNKVIDYHCFSDEEENIILADSNKTLLITLNW